MNKSFMEKSQLVNSRGRAYANQDKLGMGRDLLMERI